MNLKKIFEAHYEEIEELRQSPRFRWKQVKELFDLKHVKTETLRGAYKNWRFNNDIFNRFEKDPNEWDITSIYQRSEQGGEVTSVRFKPKTQANFVNSYLEYLKDFDYKPVKLDKPKSSESVFVLTLADLHIGKGNIDNYLREIRKKSLSLILNNKKRLSELIIYNAGDFFHIDNVRGTTTRGTQMEYTESYEKMFTKGLGFITSLITDVRNALPDLNIVYVNIRGNHDYNVSYCLGETMKYVFASDSRVEVLNTEGNRLYHYSTNNAFLFTHGDKAMDKIPLIFAVEGNKVFSKAEHRHVLVGHLHHNRNSNILNNAKEELGINIRVLNSPASSDRYHKINGYINSSTKLTIYGYNKDGKFYEEGLTIKNN